MKCKECNKPAELYTFEDTDNYGGIKTVLYCKECFENKKHIKIGFKLNKEYDRIILK